jgi:type II secretory pathway component PulC
MNRYQQEVAEMDRRHSRIIRVLSFAGTAALVAIALWSAGVHRWFSDTDSNQQVAASPSVASPATSEATMPAAVTKESPTFSEPRSLYLVATTPGRNKHEGTAQIGTSRNNPQTYVAGAILANGARIAEIHRDHVLLERGDERIKLYLHSRDTKAKGADDPLLIVGALQSVASPPLTREVLTDYLRPSPVVDDDGLHGYQVYPGHKSGIFAQLGLQPGDVITSINDAPIVDTDSAIESLREITNGTSIVVSVERKGKAERVVLDGTLITTDIERDDSSVATPPAHGRGGS